MKKLLYLVGIITFASILSSSSCGDNYSSLWEIESFSISYIDDDGIELSSGLIQSNNLGMIIRITPNYLSLNKNRRSLPFINKAYASNISLDGLKHSISKMVITSDHDFNEISAGNDISSKIYFCNTYYYNYDYNNCSNQMVETFVYNNLNQESYYFESALFKFVEKPSIGTHKITIKFIDSQGKEFISTSGEINWQ